MKGTTFRLLKGKKVWTFDSLCKEMASQYGTGGNTRQFENDLRVRKREVSETLDEYYREKHILLIRAYPDYRGGLRAKLGMDAYIDGLADRELAIKVRDHNPTTMREAHERAKMLESNRKLGDCVDPGRGIKREDRRGEVRRDMVARVVTEGGGARWGERTEEEEEEGSSCSGRYLGRAEELHCSTVEARNGPIRMGMGERDPPVRNGLGRGLVNGGRAGLSGEGEVRVGGPHAEAPVNGSTSGASMDSSPARLEMLERVVREMQAAERRSGLERGRETNGTEGYASNGAVICWDCQEEGHTRLRCPHRRELMGNSSNGRGRGVNEAGGTSRGGG